MTLPCMDNGNALGSGERKSMQEKHFERDFEGAYGSDGFRLVSVAQSEHMNFVVKSKLHGPNGVTLTRKQAEQVRDALMEVYPPEPEKHPYEVGGKTYDGYYPIIRKEPTTYDNRIATARTEEAANKIAQALNEAEGL